MNWGRAQSFLGIRNTEASQAMLGRAWQVLRFLQARFYRTLDWLASQPARATNSSAPDVAAALASSREAFIGVALFSGAINLLALTGSLYMLQLYDRVLPSRSVPTLIGLTVLMVLLYAAFGALDLLRTRVLSRVGLRMERALRDRVFTAVLLIPLRFRRVGDGLQPVRDLDQIRSFLSGPGPSALFDMPWIPIYLGLIFMLHPWLGAFASVAAVLLVALTVLTELRSRVATKALTVRSAARQVFGEASRRNAEVVRALGMAEQLAGRWSALNEAVLEQQSRASDVTSTLGAISKVLRMVLQSGILGLGAFLVILGDATGGVMIAASILMSRALAPVEIAIGHWRSFLGARQSYARLNEVLVGFPANREVLRLARPVKSLSVEGLAVAAPGAPNVVVQNVTFTLNAGAGLAVIGPSAAGKSTLVRAIVGAWLPHRGTVRLDDAALDQWNPQALGRDVGYLPQDIELFEGTIAENISRFDRAANPEAVIAAARSAGVHEMILHLPQGYESKIGEAGASLSAGQRQRIALARALFGDPFLVVLDEPNSNLDAEGDAALSKALTSVRQRGGIAIVVAHRPAALAVLDQVLFLANGQVQAFGPRDEILKKVTRNAVAAASPQGNGQAEPAAARFKVISDTGPGSG